MCLKGTIKSIIPIDSYLMYLTLIFNILYKPLTILLLLYINYLWLRDKNLNNVALVEILLAITLIYQFSIIIEFMFYNFILEPHSFELIFNVADNSNNNTNVIQSNVKTI